MKALLTACTAVVALVSFATLAHTDAPGGCAKVEVHNLRTGYEPMMLAAWPQTRAGVDAVEVLHPVRQEIIH